MNIQDIQAKVQRGEPFTSEERNYLKNIISFSRQRLTSPEGGGRSTTTTGSPESTTDTGNGSISPGIAGLLGAAVATTMGVAGAGTDVPGLPGAVGSTVSNVASGAEPEEAAKDIATSLAAPAVMNAAREVLGEFAPAGVGVAVSALDAATSGRDVPTAASVSGISSIASTIGGMLAGPFGALLGGFVAGHFARTSAEDGVLGDVWDSRTVEAMRDELEDMGYGYDETAGAASLVNPRTGTMSYGDVLDMYESVANLGKTDIDTTSKGDSPELGGKEDPSIEGAGYSFGAPSEPGLADVGYGYDTPSPDFGGPGGDLGGGSVDNGTSEQEGGGYGEGETDDVGGW